MRIEIVHKDSHSFREAHTYLAHDKASNTNERVAWIETVNLATNDPEQAWRVMAATAMDAQRLKKQAGVPPQGKKAGGPVMHLYIAWRPDEVESLTREVAVREAKGALAKLGKDTTNSKKVKHGYRFYGDELQAVIYRHTDTDHPHVHVLVNRVHPTHGRTLNDSHDHLKLSRYADKFEQRNGKLVTPQRRLNNEARARGEYVKHERKKGRGQYELEQAVNPEAHAAKQALWAKQTQRAAAIGRRQRESCAAHKRAMDRLEAARQAEAEAITRRHREKRQQIAKERQKRTGQGVQAIRDSYRPAYETAFHELQARQSEFRQNESRALGKALNALRAIDFGAVVGYSHGNRDGRATTLREAFTVIGSSGAREQAVIKAYEKERENLRRRQKVAEAGVHAH